MAMNKQRRSSNIANIFSYDDAGNIVIKDYGQVIRYSWNGLIHGFVGPLSVSSVSAATTDTDRFLVSDGGVLKYRTGVELLSDIGGVPSTRTLTINGVTQDLSADRTFTIAAGISGSGADGQVAYWNGTNSQTGSNNLIWDNTRNGLGIGNTISAWHPNYRLIQFPGGAIFSPVSTPNLYFSSNIYYDSTFTARYVNNGVGGVAGFDNGKFIFGNAVSGTAGNAATLPIQMTLTAAGRLLLGTTTEGTFLLDVNGTARVSGAMTFSGGTGVAGSVSYSSLYGLILYGNTGSQSDLLLTDRGGNLRFRIVNGGNIVQTATTIETINIGSTGGISISSNGTYGFQIQGRSGSIYDVSILENTGNNGLFINSTGQVKVGVYNSTYNSSAILEAVSTTKGFLPPRMNTTQRDAIASPAAGLQIYNTTTNKSSFYNGTAWVEGADNIYTANGTLTGNRTVTMGSNTLTFEKDLIINGVTIGEGLNSIATNTAVGASALAANTTGNQSTAIGFESLKVQTAGNFNTALGHRAIWSSTTGSSNTAIGNDAMVLGNGSSNTFIGAAAGRTANGSFNAYIGAPSTTHTISGNYNIGLGAASLGGNVSGSNNIGIGQISLSSLTSGTDNIGIGTQALNSITTSTRSIGIGFQSLFNSTGEYGLGIGTRAGFGNTTGTYNIYLGHYTNTGTGVTTGSFNTIIGSQISGLTAGLSNNIILADGQGNIRIRAWDTGNVTINSTSDSGEKLYVNGTARVSDNVVIEKNQNAQTSLQIKNSSNLSSASMNINLYGEASWAQSDIGRLSSTNPGFFSIKSSDTYFYHNSDLGNTGIVLQTGGGAGGSIKFAVNSATTPQMTFTNAGRLLLGTTSESTYILDVNNGTARMNGSTTSRSGLEVGSMNFQYFAINNAFIAENAYYNGSAFQRINTGFVSSFYFTAGGFMVGTMPSGSAGTTQANLNQRMYLTNAGTLAVSDTISGGGNITLVASAVLQADSTTRGFLPPRMTTTEKNAIATPAAGLVVYDSTTNVPNYYDGTSWVAMGGGGGTGTVTSIATTGPITGGTITTSGTIGITQSSGSTDGYLSSTDWTTFNGKVSASRTLTINGTTQDLSANRSWSVGTVTGSGATNVLPKWTSPNALGNSIIDDDGTSASVALLTGGYFNIKYNSVIKLALTGGTTFGSIDLPVGLDFKIRPDSAEGVTVFSDGNTFIGTAPSNAGYKFAVSGTSNFSNKMSVITSAITNDVALFKSTEPYITIEAAGASNSASIFLKPSTSAQNATIQNRTGGGIDLYTGTTPSLSLAIKSTGAVVASSTLGLNGVEDSVKSGKYTPTLTNVTNVSTSAVDSNVFKYTRVGDVAHVSGWLTFTATAANTLTVLELSLPIASNITSPEDVSGVANTLGGGYGQVRENSTNNTAKMYVWPTTTGNVVWYLEFSYVII